MRILIIGGMHGNELLGLKIVKLLHSMPIKSVGTVLANEQAIVAKRRYMGLDLNRSFPGSSKSKNYESQRAAQLLRLARKYDVVLDFHNTYCPDNNCGFVGENASQRLYNAAWLLGIKDIIVADYDCINKYAVNCLSVEISLNGRLDRPELWYERIKMLSKLDNFSVTPSIRKYRFVYRMSLDDKDRLDLPSKNLKAFQPMDSKTANALGVKSPALPIFIGDRFTPYNYGGILNRLKESE
jgi:hypothetical protein